jgi:hypothetical protein
LNKVFDEESLREDEYTLSELLENDEIEIIETKETGFPDRQFEKSKDDYEETHYLGKYNGKYLSWRDEFIDGIESDYQLKVFNTLEEAKIYFDSLERYPSAYEIADIFNKSNESYCLEVRYDHFDLYYENCLIAEYIDLNSRMENVLHDAISQFEEFVNKVSKNKLYLCGIYKERGWNDNQRYYIFEFEDEKENGMEKELKVHIPSVYQHRMRVSFNFLKDNYLESWLKESRNN